jgi:hypothetical protein
LGGAFADVAEVKVFASAVASDAIRRGVADAVGRVELRAGWVGVNDTDASSASGVGASGGTDLSASFSSASAALAGGGAAGDAERECDDQDSAGTVSSAECSDENGTHEGGASESPDASPAQSAGSVFFDESAAEVEAARNVEEASASALFNGSASDALSAVLAAGLDHDGACIQLRLARFMEDQGRLEVAAEAYLMAADALLRGKESLLSRRVVASLIIHAETLRHRLR